MIARHYTPLKDDYTFIEKKELDEYTFYTENLEKEITCANCGKKFEFGAAYTSRRWFTVNGVWGLWVCGKCYKKEWEELKACEEKGENE